VKLAVSTNILYERVEGSRISMEESIHACAAAGYGYLDFGFPELKLSSPFFCSSEWKAEIERYSRLAKELGVSFVQAHAVIVDFCNPPGDGEEDRELFRRSIQGAGILGVPWIVAHPSTGVSHGKRREDTHERNVAFFREMADYALDFDTGIAIENMWGKTPEGVNRYAVRAEELLRLIEDTDRKNVGACWDVEHGSIEKLDQGAAIRLLGRRLKAAHISDETGPDNIHILPYSGFVKWEEVLKALAVINYQGAFAFEIQHYLPAMPLELIPQAMKFSVQVGRHLLSRIEGFQKAQTGCSIASGTGKQHD
jgi:sugar phosphate isomerase/epimerase